MADKGAEEEDACSSCFLDIKEKLLHSLLDILASYQESTLEYEETTEVGVDYFIYLIPHFEIVY